MHSRPLNILIAHYLPNMVSGAENSIADFVGQADSRFQFTMLVPGEGPLARFYQKRGFQVWVRAVETPRRRYPGLHQAQSWLLARALKERQIDAVLCNTFPAASRVGTACRLAGIPHAIYMRDYIQDTPLHRKILRQAKAIYTISKDVKSYLKEMVDPDRVHLAYNYIQPMPILERALTHRSYGTRLLPFGPEHPVVSLVGRITPYKQPGLFLRAIPHVLRAVPEARFVVVGAAQAREKAYEDEIHALANSLGITDLVAFMGLRRDAVEIASECAVSCLTSGREPLGRVILEAHLLKVPVVVPDTGGPAEIVENEVTGLHFSSGAPDAEIQLAGQIIRLLRDPELSQRLSERAYERMFATYAGRKHVTIQEEYIDQLVQPMPQPVG